MVQKPEPGPIEAKSLSSITSIASNPPAYPRNPAHQPHEPLVLYIVKVPGSRDVFLTPLKPPTKSSISAEAINASLYYLHVSTPDDEALLREIEKERLETERLKEERGDSKPEEHVHLNNVRRKPVAGGPQSAEPSAAPPVRPELPTLTTTSGNLLGNISHESSRAGSPKHSPKLPNPWEVPARRKTVREREQERAATGTTTPQLPSRPLPQPPPDENQRPAGPHREDSSESRASESGARGPKRWSALPAPVGDDRDHVFSAFKRDTSGGRFSLDAPRLPPRPGSSSGLLPSQRPPSPTRNSYDGLRLSNSPPFRVTLIRRDPYHGTQWNVGNISKDGGPRSKDSSTIHIEITNPGYRRFIGQQQPISLASLGLNIPSFPGAENSSPTRPAPAPALAPESPQKPATSFTRDLYVVAPPSTRSRADSQPVEPTESPRKHLILGQALSKPGPSKPRTGFYTFQSPWNGTCTFTTSVNGRSLKCKHVIPGPPSGSGAHGHGHPSTSTAPPAPPAVTVSEIRFNLPTFAPANASPGLPAGVGTGTGPAGKRASLAQFIGAHLDPRERDRSRSPPGASRRRLFHRHSASDSSSADTDEHTPTSPPPVPPRPGAGAGAGAGAGPSTGPMASGPAPSLAAAPTLTPTIGPESDEDRMDLSLAHERAGGGLRGTQAKLGKLIIDDEGIKMLDLVVAASMGLWWRYYY